MIIDYMKAVYEKLHQNPEPPFQEFWTSSFAAEELETMGFKVLRGVGQTGVVGILECAQPGPCIGLRSDMDALPIHEKTGVPFASHVPGMMHACGHDSHMAITLGCCAYAARNREQFSGTLMVIFQPAEEPVAGAEAMIVDGLFQHRKPDVLLAIHNWPYIPVGSVGIQGGPVTAFSDRFVVTFTGVGGHGAFPHKTRDPIAMAVAGIQWAFSLIQRRSDPQGAQVMSIGSIHGGSSFNIIPEQVVVEGTVRTLERKDQEAMIEMLHQAFGAAADLYGGTYDLQYEPGVPAVVNHRELTSEFVTVVKKAHPQILIITEGLASLIGEDVAYFLEQIPGALLFIGSGQTGGVNELHHPKYLVPKQTLVTGFQVLTSLISHYLRNGERI